MSPLIGAGLGLLAGAAVLLLIFSLQRRPVAAVRARRLTPGQQWSRLTRRPAGRQGRRRDIKLVLVAALAVVVFVITRWPIMLLAVPAILLLVPWLLRNQNAGGIERTAAVETWVRGLRSLLQGGSENTLEGALQASLAAAPDPIGQRSPRWSPGCARAGRPSGPWPSSPTTSTTRLPIPSRPH